MSPSRPPLLTNVLRRGLAPLAFVGVFSFVGNLLYFALPIYTNQVYSRVLVSQSGATLAVLTAGALFVFVVSSFLDSVRQQILIDWGTRFDVEVAPQVFGALFEASSRRQSVPSAQPLRDVDTVRQVLTGSAVAVLFDLPWIPIFIGALFLVAAPIGAVGLCGALVLLLLAFLQDRATRRTLERSQDGAIQSFDFTDAALRNSETVQALGMLPALTARWSGRRDDAALRQADVSMRQNVYGGLIKTARMFVQILIVGVGAWLVIRGQLTAGVLFANMILSGRAMAPIDRIVGSWNSLVSAAAAFRRLSAVLEHAPAQTLRTQLPRPSGRLVVESLIYAAPGSDSMILSGVQFELPPGETLGVIGPSGAGKTSLARLLVGVWRPLKGHVRLDGADVFDWDRSALGRYVGYLPQGVELFAGTVRDNICRFRTDADDEAVVAAAQLAGAHEMINALPNGYDTDLGERGAALSAGQRQRIGLARAVFGAPALVVLDEPNAALDGLGEEALTQALIRLKAQGATVVIISHKLQAFRTADRLLLLREGRVEGFGLRDDILSRMAGPRPADAPTQQRGGAA